MKVSRVDASPSHLCSFSTSRADLLSLRHLRFFQIHLEALNVEHHTAGRRSAGLPFGILAVLLGQPKLVPSALEALLKLSTSESSEVVVTAMNALKVRLFLPSPSNLFSFASSPRRVHSSSPGRHVGVKAFNLRFSVLRASGHHRAGVSFVLGVSLRIEHLNFVHSRADPIFLVPSLAGLVSIFPSHPCLHSDLCKADSIILFFSSKRRPSPHGCSRSKSLRREESSFGIDPLARLPLGLVQQVPSSATSLPSRASGIGVGR